MAKSLNELNHDLIANGLEPRTDKIFQGYVKIQFCAAAERAVFLSKPPRIIRRRLSVIDVGSTSPQLPPAPRKQRSKSVEPVGRRYVAPQELGSIIEGLRQSLG